MLLDFSDQSQVLKVSDTMDLSQERFEQLGFANFFDVKEDALNKKNPGTKKRSIDKTALSQHTTKKMRKESTQGQRKDPYLPWTAAEDKKMTKLVIQMQTSEQKKRLRQKKKDQAAGIQETPQGPIVITWVKIAKKMPGRTSKQCRERWRNKLNPQIRRDLWTIEEDRTLLKAHKELGNRWVKLACLLPGRTENSIKTRFKSILRAKRRLWRAHEDNKVMELYNGLGSRWHDIAKQIPGRTPNGVKMRCKQLLSRTAHKTPELGAPEQAIIHLYNKQKTDFDDLSDVIPEPNDTSDFKAPEKFTKPRKSKGTRALLLEELQNNSLIDCEKKGGDEFASAIASMLGGTTKPSTLPTLAEIVGEDCSVSSDSSTEFSVDEPEFSFSN